MTWECVYAEKTKGAQRCGLKCTWERKADASTPRGCTISIRTLRNNLKWVEDPRPVQGRGRWKRPANSPIIDGETGKAL